AAGLVLGATRLPRLPTLPHTETGNLGAPQSRRVTPPAGPAAGFRPHAPRRASTLTATDLPACCPPGLLRLPPPRGAPVTFRTGTLRVLVAAALVALLPSAARSQQAKPVDFNRDVRPILSNNCFQCHGPDPNARKKDLRLDLPGKADPALIAPGKPEDSELVRRISATDPREVMPPPKTGKKLPPREIETLTAWIKDGAKYAAHWSYVKPVRPAVPEIRNPKFEIRNPIDAFIYQRLQRENLTPQPEADRYALVR